MQDLFKFLPKGCGHGLKEGEGGNGCGHDLKGGGGWGQLQTNKDDCIWT